MKWVPSGSYLTINYNHEIGIIENSTQRIVLNNNLNGSKIRVRFSNKYSKEVLILNKVTVAVKNKYNDSRINNYVNVTLNGDCDIKLNPGEECFSDEILIDVTSEDDLVISTYIENKTVLYSACSTYCEDIISISNSYEGDFTRHNDFEIKSQEDIFEVVKNDPGIMKPKLAYGINEIQVLVEDYVKVISAFGDSITHMSFWTGPFAKKLYNKYPGKVTIVNRGIGGNRILRDPISNLGFPGDGRFCGEAGINRFEEDVFNGFEVDYVVILEGINDIMHPFLFDRRDEIVNKNDLIKGFKIYADISKKYGAKVFIGTITPCRSDEYPWFEEIENTRLATNEWIRENDEYDGIIDFDSAVKDLNKSEYMKRTYHIGDGLHPNYDGGVQMAECIPLELFNI